MAGLAGRKTTRRIGASACGPVANQISVCLYALMLDNDIFHALADPTRRAIFEKLAAGSMNAPPCPNPKGPKPMTTCLKVRLKKSLLMVVLMVERVRLTLI